MERHLNNPLRPSLNPLRREPPASSPRQSSSKQPEEEAVEESPSQETAIRPLVPRSELPDSKTLFKPEIRKVLDALNASEELRTLMAQLAAQGIEIGGPKKTYIKHSYEIDQELHQRFHQMYPLLGFKKVKDAINDAISNWCDLNQGEYLRRCGPKK